MMADAKKAINTNGGPTEDEAVLKSQLDKKTSEILQVRATLSKQMEDKRSSQAKVTQK